MFSISIGGQPLDLSPGQQIVVEEESSLFKNKLYADGSELVRVPASPRNIKLLGHLDVIEITPQQTISCTVQIEARQYAGILTIQEVLDDIGINVTYNRANLTCFETNCRAFDWSVNTAPYSDIVSQYQIIADKVWPETPFYFPTIHNPAFYDEIGTKDSKDNPNFAWLINRTFVNGSNVAEPFENYFASGAETINANTMVPMIPLLEIFKRAFAHDGYSIKGTFVNHPVIKKLFVYNNKSLDVYSQNSYDDVRATNTGAFSGDLDELTIDFTSTNNGVYFNTSTDAYQIPAVGRYELSLWFELIDAEKQSLASIKVYVDGILRRTIPLGNFTLGQYYQKFTMDFVAGDVGDDLVIKLDATTVTDNRVTIFNTLLWLQTAPVAPLLSFSPVTDLAQNAPNKRFADFYNSFKSIFQLKEDIDTNLRTVDISFKNEIFNPTASLDLQQAMLLPLQQEWEPVKNYVIQWANQFDEEKTKDTAPMRQAVVSASDVLVNNPPLEIDGFEEIKPDVELLEYAPIEFTHHINEDDANWSDVLNGTIDVGDTITIGDRDYTLSAKRYSDKKYILTLQDADYADMSTCYVSERGRSQPFNLDDEESAIRIGMHENNVQHRLSNQKDETFDLALRNNRKSILWLQTQWLQYLMRSNRIIKVEINAKHPEAQKVQSSSILKAVNNPFAVQRITRTFSTSGNQQITVRMRKI